MSEAGPAGWDERHRGKPAREAEPFLVEVLARIPRGVALDVAAGRGRNALPLARAGMQVVAVDYSVEAMRLLAATARIDLAHCRKLG
jgi:2-polyprenyl-3-methyl-5-hydroxy-6-metoxy-1,4-benzoquinol methylase